MTTVRSLIIYIWSVWLLLLCCGLVLGKKSYTIRGNRMVCKNANPKFIKTLSCSIKLISRTVELYNGEGTLQPNVTIRTIHMRMSSYLRFSTVYRPLIIDTHVDICGLYSGAVKHALMISTYLDAVDENLSLGCPVRETRYVRDLKLFHEFYPDIIPSGTWRIDHDIYTKDNGKEEPLLTAQLYFVIAHNDTLS